MHLRMHKLSTIYIYLFDNFCPSWSIALLKETTLTIHNQIVFLDFDIVGSVCWFVSRTMTKYRIYMNREFIAQRLTGIKIHRSTDKYNLGSKYIQKTYKNNRYYGHRITHYCVRQIWDLKSVLERDY